MEFISYSLMADNALDRYHNISSANLNASMILLRKKIDLCNYSVLLVTSDKPKLDQIKSTDDALATLKQLFEAWFIIKKRNLDDQCRENSWNVINQISKSIQTIGATDSNSILREFQTRSLGIRFLLLLSGPYAHGLPTYKLNILCNLWQIDREYLPVHAAGVVYNNGLYIFTGASGAGKSTLARLSKEVGCAILDEDQILIYGIGGGKYTADAWGYGIDICNKPLQGVFKLVQDNDNYIIPIKSHQLAHLLLERSNDILGHMLSDKVQRTIFKQASSIARQVPGYELHFRKSPDFWKLIDEQFPD